MQSGSRNYEFGDYLLDTERGALLKAGKEIKLRPKVYEALRFLVQNPGRLIGKQELMQAIWPDAFVTEDSLVQCALELRRALGDKKQNLLKTVPRRGYIFNAEVVVPGDAKQVKPIDSERSANNVHQRTGTQKTLDLPVARTSFVGREQQVAQAAELLLRNDIRLLTLTGPGGAGKTRFAVAMAAAVAAQFTGGVQFVALASITNPELVATALVDALKLQKAGDRTVSRLISDQFENTGPFLLILDNFEQVLPAAKVVAEILEATSSLKVLVTSRSYLHVYGEHEFPVSPLAEDSAVELFAQRAAAVRPDFGINAMNADVVRQICARLDGLPLAIELAAARIKLLSPDALLSRLQSRLQLLTGGALDLPERQQTLRNTIAWSYDLLDESEAMLFRRLSAFAGGCTLEGAEAVCNTAQDLTIDVFDGLASLVDKNLIQRMGISGSEPRFSMLETIREYAAERLIEHQEQDVVRRAHAAYCLVLAEEGNPDLPAADRSRWLQQCEVETDNFRSALEWLFEKRNLDWALRLCAALFRFWDMREHLTEGREFLETVVRIAGDDYRKEQARISVFIGALATAQADFTAAERALQRSLALYEELEDETGIAASLNALAVSARDRGDYATAQSNFERSLACWRMQHDSLAIARCLHNLANVVKVRGDFARARWALAEANEIFEQLGDRTGAAWTLNQLGDLEREQGNMQVARGLYECSLMSFREVGDPWGCGRALADLGAMDCDQGDYASAEERYREALKTFAELDNKRGVARGLEGIACVALARGEARRALVLASAAAHARQLVNAHLPKEQQATLDGKLQDAWKLLSPAEGEQAWKEGLEMTVSSAIAYGLGIR